MVEVDKAIRLAVKTGKVTLGSNRTIEDIKKGIPKMVILASNCPSDIRGDIEYYAGLASIPVFIFSGSSWDLGALCNKPFMVAAMAVIEAGDSDILKLISEENASAEG